ncbi:MAG: InlB B-repeat-containing protein [Treponema sp.]|nr:InlB B-repeat-containing protein [Treponema sp.]
MKKRKLFGLLCALLTAVYFTGCPDPDPTVEEKKIVCTFLDESGNTLLTQEFDVTYTSGSANIESLKYNEKLKKTGYKFVNFVDADGNEVKEISADSTLYVVYSPITYTVKFSKGLGEETDDGKLPAEITVKYDEEFTLPDNKLSYSGKKAVGWYTEEYDLDTLKSEKKRYSNGEKLKNLTERDNDTIEFTADFNDFDCVVTFIIGYNVKTFNLDKDSALPEIPEIPEKTGYTIGGWVEYDDTTNTIVDFTDYKVTKTVTYTAKYNPKSYKVTFKTAHGTAPDAITRYADASLESLSVSPYNSLTATGYNFAGWFDENGKEYKYLTSYASDWEDGDLPDLTLTAKWTPWTIHQVFVDASTDLESLPDGYYYDTRASYPTRDVDYDTEVTMPGAELYKSLPDGFKLVGWVKGDEYGSEIKKTEADYEVSAAFKNGDVTKDGETIYFYGFVEGPSVKIAVKVPSNLTLDEEAQIKPSSSNAAFAFDSVYLSDSVSGKEFPFSNTVNKKDDYYVLNKTASSYATLYPEMFTAGTHSYTLKGYLGYNYDYEQTISVTIVEGEEVSLNFNDMKYTKTSYGDPQGHILLNFKPEEGITVTGVKFAGKDFQVTDNLWNYSDFSDLGTKSLFIYMDKDGKTYMSDEIKIQTAAGCISSSTIAFEFTNNNIVMTINQQ